MANKQQINIQKNHGGVAMILGQFLYVSSVIICMVAAGEERFRRHADGSMTSNSGSSVSTENQIFRAKRAAAAKTKSTFSGRSRRLVQSLPPNANWTRYLHDVHNDFRMKVPARDMQYLEWDPQLTRSAQIHADTCDFLHSKWRKNTGENIWAAPFSDYSKAVQLWFDEVYDPKCLCQHVYKHCCGHYTQVVWSETNRVGCGAARCASVNGAWGMKYVLVCHYTPTGNVIVARNGGLRYKPAFRWHTGNKTACSACPSSSNSCYKGKLCRTV